MKMCLLLIVMTLTMNLMASPLFGEPTILEMKIEADFTELRDNHLLYDGEAAKTLPAKVKLLGQEFSVEVKNSANSRLSCEVIPMKLLFHKKQTKGTIFEDNEKLKLTTHCGKYYGHKINNENLYREYKHYKNFYRHSKYHLKVRLVRVRYIDTNPKSELKKLAEEVNLAFLTESDKSFKKRMGMEEVEAFEYGVPTVTYPELTVDMKQYKKVKWFNASIGNGDWGVSFKEGIFYTKNIKVFHKDKIAYIIPYDFNGARKIINRNYLIYYSEKFLK